MSRFTGRPLLALGRVYSFVGGIIGLKEVALDGRIQVVHDIGRMAELGAAGEIGRGGGFWYITVSTTHAAASRDQASIDVYAAQGTRGYDPLPDEWCWYIAGMGRITVGANLGSCLIGVHNQSTVSMSASSTDPGIVCVEAFQSAATTSLDGTSEPLIATELGRTGPVPIPRGESAGGFGLRVVSETSGAATTVINALIWKGKTGTFPPGYD